MSETFKLKPIHKEAIAESLSKAERYRLLNEPAQAESICRDVLRDREGQADFVGPRFMVRLASLEMHPLDAGDRIAEVKDQFGSGMCNITRCCTDVCPEHINITDNGIIPLKERVVDRAYDPVAKLLRVFGGGRET